MLLAVDIGNSNIVLALHNQVSWVKSFRIATLVNEPKLYYKKKIVDLFFEEGISLHDINTNVLSSVVPVLRDLFEEIMEELFEQAPVVVRPALYPPISLDIDHHDEIGTDLFANAVAAHARFAKNAIVVDFGTALTFTVVSEQGQILGVNIVPGLKTAIRALVGNTAQLPEVPLEMPSSAIGKNTTTAIQNGILRGYVGLVRHQLASIRAELGGDFIAVATGGLSKILTELADDFHAVDINLTIDGLRLIGDYQATLNKKPVRVDYQCISCSFYDELEAFATLKRKVKITYQASDASSQTIADVIVDFRTQNKAEYLITQTGLEIRLDLIQAVVAV